MSDPAEEAAPFETPVLPRRRLRFIWLQPDLARHPELLDAQVSPKRHKGDGVVDLQQFMMERLKTDVAKLRADQDEIIANSRDNLITTERIHNAVIALLEVELRAVHRDRDRRSCLPARSRCRMPVPELTDVTSRRPKHDGIQFDRGAVDRLIGKNRKVWLRDEVEGDPEIYGGAADLVRSDAVLVPASAGGCRRDLHRLRHTPSGHFHAGQGTELMNEADHRIRHPLMAGPAKAVNQPAAVKVDANPLLFAKADLVAALKGWLSHLAQERRAAKLTIEAYQRDVGDFLRFLSFYDGDAPNVARLGASPAPISALGCSEEVLN